MNAIPTGPIDRPPYGVIPSNVHALIEARTTPAAVRRELLTHALRGVELGDWDLMILNWLTSAQDNSTVVTIISWLERARLAGACDGDTKAVAP
jgi:hypothetical protein